MREGFVAQLRRDIGLGLLTVGALAAWLTDYLGRSVLRQGGPARSAKRIPR